MESGVSCHLGFFGITPESLALRIRNDEVVGSIPTSSTKFSNYVWRFPSALAVLRRCLCQRGLSLVEPVDSVVIKSLANPARALVLFGVCTLSLVDPELFLLHQTRSTRSIGHDSWIGSSDHRLGLSGKNLYVARRL